MSQIRMSWIKFSNQTLTDSVSLCLLTIKILFTYHSTQPLKVTIQGLLELSELCYLSPPSILDNFHDLKEKSCAFWLLSHYPPSPKQPLMYFYFCRFAYCWVSYINGIIQYVRFLTSSFHLTCFKVHPCCSMYQFRQSSGRHVLPDHHNKAVLQ